MVYGTTTDSSPQDESQNHISYNGITYAPVGPSPSVIRDSKEEKLTVFGPLFFLVVELYL